MSASLSISSHISLLPIAHANEVRAKYAINEKDRCQNPSPFKKALNVKEILARNLIRDAEYSIAP